MKKIQLIKFYLQCKNTSEQLSKQFFLKDMHGLIATLGT